MEKARSLMQTEIKVGERKDTWGTVGTRAREEACGLSRTATNWNLLEMQDWNTAGQREV